MRRLLTEVTRTVAMLALFWLILYANGAFAPYCPTEDSCTADYRHGAWHIERTTP